MMSQISLTSHKNVCCVHLKTEKWGGVAGREPVWPWWWWRPVQTPTCSFLPQHGVSLPVLPQTWNRRRLEWSDWSSGHFNKKQTGREFSFTAYPCLPKDPSQLTCLPGLLWVVHLSSSPLKKAQKNELFQLSWWECEQIVLLGQQHRITSGQHGGGGGGEEGAEWNTKWGRKRRERRKEREFLHDFNFLFVLSFWRCWEWDQRQT